MLEIVRFRYSGRNFGVKARKLSFFGRISGLMFKSRNSENLLFEFSHDVKEPIHSFFVFFPFLALWIDSSGKVVGFKVVKPFRFYICPRQKFRKLLELPINAENKAILRAFSSENKKI